MPCTVCNHPEHQAIDQALLHRTATLAQLSARHGLSTSALSRHKQHLQHKMARAQSRYQDMLRESYLFYLNEFLQSVWQVARAAAAEGNSRLLLQAIRQGTGILRFMAKLDSALSAETVHRLLDDTQWDGQEGLLPTDPRFLQGCRQALAASLLTPCPEAGPADAPLSEAELAALAQFDPALFQDLLAGLAPALDAGAGSPPSANRAKSGKKAGQTAANQHLFNKSQPVSKFSNHSGKSPRRPPATPPSPLADPLLGPGNWLEDLDAGRLGLDFLNAVGTGRCPKAALTQASVLGPQS